MLEQRLRTWAKWAFTLVAALVVGLAMFSGLFDAKLIKVDWGKRTARWVGVSHGLFWAMDISGDGVTRMSRQLGSSMNWSPAWSWGVGGERPEVGNRWPWHAGVLYERTGVGRHWGMSMGYPVVITCIPAALLWHCDRRRYRAGLCAQCGYDHRGLAAGTKCPECGSVPTGG